MTDFYLPYESRGLEILSVGLEPDENNLMGIASSMGLNYKLLIDDTMQTIKSYKINSIPLNIVVDKQGIIRYRKAGYDSKGIRKIIDELL